MFSIRRVQCRHCPISRSETTGPNVPPSKLWSGKPLNNRVFTSKLRVPLGTGSAFDDTMREGTGTDTFLASVASEVSSGPRESVLKLVARSRAKTSRVGLKRRVWFKSLPSTAIMSSLTVRFKRDDLPDYKLDRHRDASAEKFDYTFELLESTLLHEGETFNVYRGTLQRSDNMSTAAVVKLGWRDSHPDAEHSLAHEWALYNGRLKKLQNKSVPLCYGLFQGKTDHGYVTGLLLQDLGGHEDRDKYWADYSPDEKYVTSTLFYHVKQNS